MDIRNWPLDRIMQLPDCVFGRRWPMGLHFDQDGEAFGFDIHEQGLPERFVIWEVTFWLAGLATEYSYVGIRLSDQLPATLAEYNRSAPLMRGCAGFGDGGITWHVQGGQVVTLTNLKVPVMAAGQRLLVRMTGPGALMTGHAYCVVTVSSIPKEIPDCLTGMV